jgi:glucose/arabinose dehydrogenase
LQQVRICWVTPPILAEQEALLFLVPVYHGMPSPVPTPRQTFGRICSGIRRVLVALAATLFLGDIVGQTTEDAFAGLTFDQPLGIVSPPGETGHIFILEKAGIIQVVTGLDSTPVKQPFFDLRSRVLTSSEQGLLGLAFHPNFAANRYFYVFYSTTATTSAGTGAHERVSRFTALAAPATNADILATEVPLISQYDQADNHNGGDLHFGPDGYLYVALGDEGGANDQYNNSQRIDKDFFSALLRIDVDQRAGSLVPNSHPSVHAGTYKIPSDNPFVGVTSFNGSTVNPADVRSEFWAVGLRNPWRFSFDSPTGRLFVGDVGQSAREEIDLVTRGGNYGWNYREGKVAGPRGSLPAAASLVDPIWDADRTLAGSITGGVVYRGSRFPDLSGQYVFGDYVKNQVFTMTFPSSGPVQVTPIVTVSTPAAFGVDPRNGDILIASIATGKIRRLVYSVSQPAAPTITTQPVDQNVTVGHAVTFSAASSAGTGQWQISTDNGSTWTGLSDGGAYSGTTTNALTISGATAGLTGARYRFVASNGGGSVNSAAATLTVSPVLFPSPMGLALDSSGNLYVSDSTSNILQKVTVAGSVSLLAGASGTAGATDGTAGAALFSQPGGLVLLGSGFIFVSDTANSTIRRVAADGGVTTFAGSSTIRGNTNGNGSSATFSNPMGIAADSSGNLYVADAGNHTVRRITSAGAVTTFAGGAGVLGSNDGSVSAARFNRPGGVAIDAAGNVYVADTTNNTIRRISSGTVTTFAGVAGISGATDGTGANALFNQPAAVAIDASGNIYVTDTGNSTIRKITSAGVVTTLAGLPTVAGLQDGSGGRGWFNQPKGLAVDTAGNIYVADTGNAALRKVTSQGMVTTLTLTAASSPPPTPPPPPAPPPTPTPTNPSSGGGGGGAMGGCLFGELFLLILFRYCSSRTKRIRSSRNEPENEIRPFQSR